MSSLKRTIAYWCRWVAEWLDPQQPLLAEARAVVRETQLLNRRGAYKAAVAIGRMRQRCPGEKESRLRWAIETAVQELP